MKRNHTKTKSHLRKKTDFVLNEAKWFLDAVTTKGANKRTTTKLKILMKEKTEATEICKLFDVLGSLSKN